MKKAQAHSISFDKRCWQGFPRYLLKAFKDMDSNNHLGQSVKHVFKYNAKSLKKIC